jgi:hypothetical protein
MAAADEAAAVAAAELGGPSARPVYQEREAQQAQREWRALPVLRARPASAEPQVTAGASGGAGTAGAAGATGGAAGTVATYSALSDTSKWSQFALTPVSNNNTRFSGGTFDGRYVYFAPVPPLASTPDPSVFLRHDTQVTSSFDQGWEALDGGTLGLNDTDFGGAVFDGRYVYYVPSMEGRQTAPTRVPSGRVVRYDTRASFTATASWQQHTIAPAGFVGGVFDGRYIYFSLGSDRQSRASTRRAISRTPGLDAVRSVCPGRHGDAVLGRRVRRPLRLLRSLRQPGGVDVACPGVVARYDTTASFTSQDAWSKFALTSIDARAMGYSGGRLRRALRSLRTLRHGSHGHVSRARDQIRHAGDVHRAPLLDQLRHRKRRPARHRLSLRRLRRALRVLLSPCHLRGTSRASTRSARTAIGAHGRRFELNAAGFYAGGSIGAVFTGRYLYLIPYIPQGPGAARWTVRFDAKTPPALPTLPAHFGSFY